jgi:cytidine deaminase
MSYESDLPRMIELARDARTRSYSPYSKFKVGACVRGASGELYPGANVENAAYPHGTCAEASALDKMANAGERRASAIVVIGGGDALVTPCGGCRQRIREFGDPATPIIICGEDGTVRARFTLDELLPHSFGPDHLA